jgi:hypothetical protein
MWHKKKKDIILLQLALFSDNSPTVKEVANYSRYVGRVTPDSRKPCLQQEVCHKIKTNGMELHSYTFSGLSIRSRHQLNVLDTCNLGKMTQQGCSWAPVTQGGALVLFWVLGGATLVLPSKDNDVTHKTVLFPTSNAFFQYVHFISCLLLWAIILWLHFLAFSQAFLPSFSLSVWVTTFLT